MYTNPKISSHPVSRRSFGLISLVGLGATLTACGSSSNSADTSVTPSAPVTAGAPETLADGMGTTAASGEFPRTVKHFRGETTIDAKPEKVIVLSTGQLDDVLALGLVPIATTSAKDADLVPGYLKDAYPDHAGDLEQMDTVGTRAAPDTEAIANLTPDLILINNTNDDEAIYDALAAIAPTVVTEGTGVNWKQDYLLCAAAIGDTDTAEEKMQTYRERASQVGGTIDDGMTFSFLRVTSDRTRVFGVSSFVGSIAEDAGLARPESQQVEKTSVDISSEQLDQADGSWIFYGVQGGDATTLESEALWETLGAVVADQAVQVDDDMFYLNAGITAALGVLDTIEEKAGQ